MGDVLQNGLVLNGRQDISNRLWSRTKRKPFQKITELKYHRLIISPLNAHLKSPFSFFYQKRFKSIAKKDILIYVCCRLYSVWIIQDKTLLVTHETSLICCCYIIFWGGLYTDIMENVFIWTPWVLGFCFSWFSAVHDAYRCMLILKVPCAPALKLFIMFGSGKHVNACTISVYVNWYPILCINMQ